MDEITNAVTSPIWIFSTIFVGLIVNILSAYAKPKIDEFVGKYSDTRKMKSENEKRLLQLEINKLVLSPQALAEAFENELRARLRSIMSILLMLLEFLFLIVAISINARDTVFGAIFMLFCLVMILFTGTLVLRYHRDTIRMTYIMQVARKRLIKLGEDASKTRN